MFSRPQLNSDSFTQNCRLDSDSTVGFSITYKLFQIKFIALHFKFNSIQTLYFSAFGLFGFNFSELNRSWLMNQNRAVLVWRSVLQGCLQRHKSNYDRMLFMSKPITFIGFEPKAQLFSPWAMVRQQSNSTSSFN